MAKNLVLVIVESPTKAKTISRFLGSDFIIESSFGHIRDLPVSKLGVDVENNFEPQYIIPKRAKLHVKKLKEELKTVGKVILATDEDREGEAIAWHLVHALGLNEPKAESRKPKATIERIVFHEITKKAIEEALKNPRQIDTKLVDAQQARRVLDRLVGYKLSPFLWKKVSRGLSAGRVQSVAVRLIVEREREILAFKPEEYWSLEATLEKNNKEKLVATLAKINGETLNQFAVKNSEEAENILKSLAGAEWFVKKIEKKSLTRNPGGPFTTSTLQQGSWNKLRFSAKQTMVLAQQLYEGMDIGETGATGLITYMRTDSMNISQEALKSANEFLEKKLGADYALPSPRIFKTKSKGAQEAHEAIRPTDPQRTPESIKQYLDHRQYKLYDLIWKRFIASQMPAAIFDSTAADIAATANSKQTTNNYTFRANGSTLKFDGFLKIYSMKFEEVFIPELAPEEKLNLVELKPDQHFTEAPPRYTEASLVKIMEKFGIGRPSTYAPTMATIQVRGYVAKDEKRRFIPTEIGAVVNDVLVEHFPEIVDIQFTAKMEEELDEIAEGKLAWQPVIREFYEPFSKHLGIKYEEVKKHEVEETTEEICDKCGRPMVIKLGRFGKFLACSGFPECKNAKNLKSAPETIGMKCPKCKEGDILIRRTRKKRIFFGCSRYPECDYASWTDPRKDSKFQESPDSKKFN